MAPYAWTGKGDALLASGRYDEAIIAYDRALELYPVFADTGIAQKGKGDSLTKLGKREEALAAYGAAVVASDKAITAFNNATPLDKAVSFTFDPYPLDKAFWNNRGSVLKALGRQDEADAAFAEAKEPGTFTVTVTQENTAGYWIKKGNNLVGNGSFEEALQDYDQAILIDAQNAEAWRGKGNAQSILGQHDEGNQSFEKSLNLYDEIIKANPDDMNVRLNKSMVLTALGRPKEALNVLDNIIELDPKNYGALGRKAEVLSIIGMYNESINTFDKALQMIPASATETLFSFWMSKGWTLLAHSDNGAALTAFEKGITLNPEDGSAWFFKGDALKALGRQSEAEAAFAKAKELDYEG
jgi:tetratricopeptide (TPR) repeat protein